MTDKVFGSTTEMIKSRGYLLDFQKKKLLEDLEFVESDDEQMGEIIDRIFYRLFGVGWKDLTPQEIADIRIAWGEK